MQYIKTNSLEDCQHVYKFNGNCAQATGDRAYLPSSGKLLKTKVPNGLAGNFDLQITEAGALDDQGDADVPVHVFEHAVNVHVRYLAGNNLLGELVHLHV